METASFSGPDQAARYRELMPVLRRVVDGEPDLIANLANIGAVLKECIAAASWVGFYLRRGEELVLGPFQGKLACVRIPLGRGVCGTVAAREHTLIVPDVDAFPGHIACDGASRSEIVVPVFAAAPTAAGGRRLVAVLDVDSHEPAAFDDTDAKTLAQVAELAGGLNWPPP